MEPDREIVRRVLAGERDAFRDVVRAYQRLVAHVVGRLVRDPGDREEVCQDVFVRVHRKLDTFHFESKLSTWIARIAYRLSLNHLEKKRLPLADDLGPEDEEGMPPAAERIASPDLSPADEVAAAQMRAFVRAQVDALPPLQRAAVTLYHLEEMSVGEVAEVMGVPENTVKSHLFRARKTLKERLMATYGEEARTA
ncbi:MAG TPA: sigma-70 family RNA polymerase sigma factor [Longimicrobium sp.]|nr:sigma-70 family RNA polymerase sigma factor [Longimicrobium sp.]